MVSNAYKKYINSKEWYRKRERWLEQADYECQWCSRRRCRLQVHHLTYERLFNERDDDVIVLCSTCHKWADKIRKILSNTPHKEVLRDYAESVGYPHDMKRNYRGHVRRFKRRLEDFDLTLDRVHELSPAQRVILRAMFKES